ncbi:MAG: hypothetical protein A2655_00120 [Candidatus Yanofskybacteria bacterium RIFCSPHIGHO2_01_FULL_43_42]|uniref:Uncharacterized protein n=1 Tax=Candidatus Yanofskybacteria bacterium RIFCSPLOWO2_01_FULL_43_22 TaxID=1802695 RepID=A0A1F8GEJ0_9BACT|nr:MAG: hypothetical protein A2655_00120 [Candidatus Yanofskybacteria bacterium RIFCSPHIGHO2_01_FULL_43_42]OGN12554.1 MAG: hypothetical protein A3D48_04455 [Candidatus Yanofskybacteria bacterium RIFCSPHIGHO2_02_FULL_43_17]OGN23701.1 MAG: hypothetical protein A3A13_00115 [Candidatus Yanofskybacteria bacterium RIFCSPLOWO2_01_FULL_43_22]
MKAYIVEPVKPGISWELFSESNSQKVFEIARLITEKYPEVTIAGYHKYPGTEIINTLVIHVPDTLTREAIEEEFSCGLLPVAYEPKSS